VKKKGITKTIGQSRGTFSQSKKQAAVAKLKVAAKKEARLVYFMGYWSFLL